MKYVTISIDDGRLDTYEYAVPILRKYNLKATINITTDFIENSNHYMSFGSALNKAMSIQNLKELDKEGFEIACHGNKHINSLDDIETGIEKLKNWGIGEQEYGFASPFSEITKDSHGEIIKQVSDHKLLYVRSGKQVRREQFLFKVAYALQELFRSKKLFYLLNKKSCGLIKEKQLLYIGITVNNKTSLSQIKYLINKLPEESFVILILHSVLPRSHDGYGKDKWYMDKDVFEALCDYLRDCSNIQVVTNKEVVKIYNV